MIELYAVGAASGFALWLGGYLVGARRAIASRAALRGALAEAEGRASQAAARADALADRLSSQLDGAGEGALASASLVDERGRHYRSRWVELPGWRCLLTVEGPEPLPPAALDPTVFALNRVLQANLGRPFPPLPRRAAA